MKKYGTAFLFMLAFSISYACDVCSFSGTNSMGGQILQANQSFVALGWNNIKQNSNDGRIYNNHFLNFTGAYAFKEKWQVTAMLPLQYQFRLNNENEEKNTGLSDAAFTLTFQSFNTADKKNKAGNHALFNTAGIKLPTGKYNSNSPEFAPLGTGSIDWIIGNRYVFEKNNMGINVHADIQLNMANNRNFRYGNIYRTGAFYFVKRNIKNSVLMPMAGYTAERLDKDQSNGFVRPASGGQGIFALAGFQSMINEKCLITTRAEIPLYQNFESFEGPVKASYRIQAQFAWMIKQKTPKQKISIDL
jgi:hypothetical protein